MTRMSDVVEETPKGQPIEIRPMKAFPHIKDLVTDVSWNYEVAQRIAPIRGPEEPNWKFNQTEAHRVQHFRECIECFLCVNTCHVLRDHQNSMPLQARETWFASHSTRCTAGP
ncbi:MAG: hypothetical protein CM15mP128_1600 [Methanobacteriota archaeon]|nr:MAG: hypothetical protein CM15mP128_1600 [Euryarchaeota archaeon]